MCNQAYLIKEGECVFQSSRNPLVEFNESRITRRPMDVTLRSNRGFMSSTTVTFQFGLLEKNQWIAEERFPKDKKKKVRELRARSQGLMAGVETEEKDWWIPFTFSQVTIL